MKRQRVRIGVGSSDDTVLVAVKEAFTKIFSDKDIVVIGIASKKKFTGQIFGNLEILQGAKVSMFSAADSLVDTDFCVGVENGIVTFSEGNFDLSWVIVKESNSDNFGLAFSTGIQFPKINLDFTSQKVGEYLAMMSGQSAQVDAQAVATNDLVHQKDLLVMAILSAFGTMR